MQRIVTRLLLAAAIALCICSGSWSIAQDACRTANCAAPGQVPVACGNRAAPATLQVNFTGTTLATYAFTPNRPKIEPGDCIRWSQSSNAIHNGSDSACNDDVLCAFAPSFGCRWETGNVSTVSNPSRICHYASPIFPGSANAAGLHFYCRIHAGPADTTGMVGDLRVTTPIVLTVGKSGASPVLSWTGGGVTGDFTYDVIRSHDDTLFLSFTTLASGVIAGNTHTDSTTVPGPGLHAYLVKNRNL